MIRGGQTNQCVLLLREVFELRRLEKHPTLWSSTSEGGIFQSTSLLSSKSTSTKYLEFASPILVKGYGNRPMEKKIF